MNILISGCIGPRGDGYKANNVMTSGEAKEYHFDQVNAFASAGADVVTALTMNYSDEALGITLATKSAYIPVVVSFTLETDGNLPNGETLKGAIEKVDKESGHYPKHFMINCAHPLHFLHVLNDDGLWKSRIKGIRANASTKSHAELDESETLDTGEKPVLAFGYHEINT